MGILSFLFGPDCFVLLFLLLVSVHEHDENVYHELQFQNIMMYFVSLNFLLLLNMLSPIGLPFKVLKLSVLFRLTYVFKMKSPELVATISDRRFNFQKSNLPRATAALAGRHLPPPTPPPP